MRIPLNRSIFLNGEEYPLVLNVTEGDTNGHLLDLVASIEIPADYPETEFRKKCLEHPVEQEKNEFGCVHMIYYGTHVDVSSYYLHINRYDNQMVALPEEKVVFKGLGKVMFCIVLNMMKNKIDIPDETQIVLVASGGMERCTDAFVQMYNKYDAQELIKMLCDFHGGARGIMVALRDIYPDIHGAKTIEEILDFSKTIPPETNKELIYTVCVGIENHRLVQYYNKTFGFEFPEFESVGSVWLSTTVGNVLSHC